MMGEDKRYLKYTTIYAEEAKPDEVLCFEILTSKMMSQQMPTDIRRMSLGMALNLLHLTDDIPEGMEPTLEIVHRLDADGDESSQE